MTMKHSRSCNDRTNDLLQVVARERKRLRLDAIEDAASELGDMSQSFAPLKKTAPTMALPLSAAILEATTRTSSYKVPQLIHRRVEDHNDDGSSSTFDEEEDEAAAEAGKKSPLPYKAYVWSLPPSSTSAKMGEHWMRVTRPLAMPPKLPTSRDITRSISKLA